MLISRENPKKNPIVQEYVLPDHSGATSTTGYIRSGPNAEPREGQTKKGNLDDEEQVLWMGNERFMGPELLFNPSDIGESILKVIADVRTESAGIVGNDSRGDLEDARGAEGDVLGQYRDIRWIGICGSSW
jgi:hypothetical protein